MHFIELQIIKYFRINLQYIIKFNLNLLQLHFRAANWTLHSQNFFINVITLSLTTENIFIIALLINIGKFSSVCFLKADDFINLNTFLKNKKKKN